MVIHNREQFLQTIAKRLGRSEKTIQKPKIQWTYQPQHELLKSESQDELVETLIEQCKYIHTDIYVSTISALKEKLAEVLQTYGNGPIIYGDDERLSTLQIEDFLQSEPNSFKWSPNLKNENIQFADRANIGIVVSDITLAESGSIVLQTSPTRGRTISFLPENSIAIIPKHTIVPRMTQAAQILRQLELPVSSCINFITGPSNSADIEMNLVVGVHGPVQMTYIVVEDY